VLKTIWGMACCAGMVAALRHTCVVGQGVVVGGLGWKQWVKRGAGQTHWLGWGGVSACCLRACAATRLQVVGVSCRMQTHEWWLYTSLLVQLCPAALPVV
jgi:hypothetical protein